nr:MAG TPA: hypothetical protein [Caudoviricetes sp.]
MEYHIIMLQQLNIHNFQCMNHFSHNLLTKEHIYIILRCRI